VALDVIASCSALGSTIGDMDGDGLMEVIGSGANWSPAASDAGQGGIVVNVNELVGADPEDSSSWERDTIVFPRTATSFNNVMRDSAGVDLGTTLQSGPQGPEFVSKLAYLGDVDNNGFRSLAVAFQGVDDYTRDITENFVPADSTYDDVVFNNSVAYDNRIFLSIVSSNGLAVSNETIILPSDYKLSSNYPNPFNPTTSFDFTLPIEKTVSVKIYDIAGRLVRTLINNETRLAGTHVANWDGKDNSGLSVVSGTYLYSLEYGNFRQSRTMTLLK